MATPTIDISKFKADLEADFERVEIELDLIIQAGLADGVQEAVTRCPVDNGILKNSINFSKVEALVYDFFAAEFYAPFVEFGTGKGVVVPAGYEQLARESGDKAIAKGRLLFGYKGRKINPNNRAQPFFVPGLEKALAIIKDNFTKLKV